MGTGAEVAAPEVAGAAKGAGELAGAAAVDEATGAIIGQEFLGSAFPEYVGIAEGGPAAAGLAAAGGAGGGGGGGDLGAGTAGADLAAGVPPVLATDATGAALGGTAGADVAAGIPDLLPTDAAGAAVPQAATLGPGIAPAPTGGAPTGAEGAWTDIPPPLEGVSTAPTTPTAGPGIGQKLIDQITGNPLTAGALGLNLAGQMSARNAAKSIPGQLKQIAQPTSDISKSLLDQYQAGQISPSSEFDIQQWENQQLAAVKNYYAKAGIPDSQAAKTAIGNVQAKAAAMRDQSRQGLLTSGLQAAGMAAGPLTSAVQAQAQQDQALTQASGSALNSLLLLQAMQNKSGG